VTWIFWLAAADSEGDDPHLHPLPVRILPKQKVFRIWVARWFIFMQKNPFLRVQGKVVDP
jgi:hypothetical protein